MRSSIRLSKEIYKIDKIIDYRRIVVFSLRSWSNKEEMKRLVEFIDKFQLHPHKNNLCEIAGRNWLFKGSSFDERSAVIQNHFRFLESTLTKDGFHKIYGQEGRLVLWEYNFQEKPLTVEIHFDNTHRKEGLAALGLYLNGERLYRMMFWISPDPTGEMALWIGTLQGSPNGLDIVRALTKDFFGYRTKNFALYAMRAWAQQLGLKKIYAISDNGFFTNNHFRINRAIKTSLDAFWQETEGTLSVDKRFYELPLKESRKTIEEVVTHKRNLYRKRFQKLDQFEEEFCKNLSPYLKQKQ